MTIKIELDNIGIVYAVYKDGKCLGKRRTRARALSFCKILEKI